MRGAIRCKDCQLWERLDIDTAKQLAWAEENEKHSRGGWCHLFPEYIDDVIYILAKENAITNEDSGCGFGQRRGK